MTSGEKALYHSIIEQLKDKELSDSQKDNFVKKLDELFKSMNDQSKEFQLNSIFESMFYGLGLYRIAYSHYRSKARSTGNGC